MQNSSQECLLASRIGTASVPASYASPPNAPASPLLDELAHRFGLHELQIEDCRHRPQRAKLEEHDRYLFAVLKHLTPNIETDFGDVDVFVGPEFLVTVHQAASAPLIEKVRRRLEQGHVERLDKVFYLIVDTAVDECIPLLDELADQISDVEAEMLKPPEPDVLARIFRLKRTLAEFRRITGAMREWRATRVPGSTTLAVEGSMPAIARTVWGGSLCRSRNVLLRSS